MNFNAPWPSALQMLVHQQIVPKHYLESVGTKGFIDHPIGTGPFQFISAAPNFEVITLERFEAYYGGALDLLPSGPACVEHVIFQVIPDTLTRVAALRVGEVHIIQAVPEDLIAVLAESSEVIVRTAPGTRPVWMDMNTTQPPFDDFRVRQAFNYAIDKERIVDEVYGGRALVLPGPLSPFNNFVSKDLSPYPFDRLRAIALLRAASWEDSDQDDLLDKDGSSFVFILDTLEMWRPLAEAIRRQLGEIGIEVIIRYWERSIIRTQALEGERMAYLDGWGDSAFDPVGHFEAKWHTYIEGEPYGRGNYSIYSNERVDELIRLGETSTDPTLRQKYYDEAQATIYVEAPAVFLILPEVIEAASIRVWNWEPASDGRINLHDVCLTP
jgi:peptide/nickel transport system substrate-binding protein